MRNQSKAAKKRAEYFTLPQAVSFIIENNNPMTEEEARQELLEALCDGKIFIRWEDEKPPPNWVHSSASPPQDYPSLTESEWKTVDIDWTNGAIFFQPEIGSARWRVLWLRTLSVSHIWRATGANETVVELHDNTVWENSVLATSGAKKLSPDLNQPRKSRRGAGNPGVGKRDSTLIDAVKNWPRDKPINLSHIACNVGGVNANQDVIKGIIRRMKTLEKKGQIDLGEKAQ